MWFLLLLVCFAARGDNFSSWRKKGEGWNGAWVQVKQNSCGKGSHVTKLISICPTRFLWLCKNLPCGDHSQETSFLNVAESIREE